jgi:hypothetical protein
MAGVGIGLGILAFLLVGGFHGLIAGIWVAWPFFHHAGVSRYNFLHPVPKEYSVPLKQAFAQIRDILSDISYNFGDRWHINTADPIQRRITASLRFTEEESHLEGSSLSNIHKRTERVQRFLELEVQFKDTGQDTTIIQFDFHPRVEGPKWYACDYIVEGIGNRVQSTLGAGTDRGKPADTTLPAPPWWMIGLGAFAVLSLASSIITAVMK